MSFAYKRYETAAVEIDRYIDSMENNRDRFLANIEQTTISSEHFDFFRQNPSKFLVITEDWCIDSVQFIPVLVQLAREIPDIEIKVLRRDQHTDLADNYRRKDGYQAIPVIIAFDEDGAELGAIVERPEQATAELAEETRRFQEANPHLDGIKRNVDRMPEETQKLVKANSREWRLQQQDRFADHLLNELRQVVTEGREARVA